MQPQKGRAQTGRTDPAQGAASENTGGISGVMQSGATQSDASNNALQAGHHNPTSVAMLTGGTQDLGIGPVRAGLRIGFLGGSFDPPHEGHIHIAREALRRLQLDRVVLLVSPGNPLKTQPHGTLQARMAATRALADHPRIFVSDAEARLGTRFTAETLSALRRRMKGVHMVWLMGADNLAQFHRWDQWQAIMAQVPVAVLARPGHRLSARFSVAARRYARARLPDRACTRLPLAVPPAWCFLTVPLVPLSSTQIRAKGQWRRENP